MTTPVSFEIAKLLKEKDFNLNKAAYNYSEENNYELGLNVYTKEDLINFKIYPAPTISEVVIWLYEKHGIWITVWKYYNEGFYFAINSITNTDTQKLYNSPTEAYEAGVEYVLKNLIK